MARWVTFVLSLIGLGIGVWAVSTARQTPPEIPLAREASVNPYSHGVAALGIIEPAGREVRVFAPEQGLVVEVLVDVGDKVEAGQPLFRLDARRLEADLLRAEAGTGSGRAEIARWEALPREEDLPPLEAGVVRAEALVRDREDTLRRTKEAVEQNAVSARELTAAEFALDGARAELVQAQANLARAKAGGWAPDLALAQAALAAQEQDVAALKLLIERLTARSPRAGTILRREIEPGEFAGSDLNRPAMILGDLSTLYVRAQVDEEDIALVGAAPRAVARTRGAAPESIGLTLVRVEPYARPKTDLLGVNTERVDTRVVDVVFRMEERSGARVYPGQAVDVFIEAAGAGRSAGASAPAPPAPGASPDAAHPR
jgi:HlyD family secretion protein